MNSIDVSYIQAVIILVTTAAVFTVLGAVLCYNIIQDRYINKELLRVVIEHLHLLRSQVIGNSAWAKHIIKDTEAGRYTLASLGTTVEELISLGHRLDHKERAVHCLGCLRGGSNQYRECIVKLPVHLKEAGLTLVDIGTNEEEFAAFPKMIVTRRAIDEWRWVVQSFSHLTNHFIDARDWLESEKLAPSDIGIPAEDFKKIAAMVG